MAQEFFGLTGETAQTAKVVAGAGVGAAAFIYWRHPGTLLRAVLLYSISVGLAVVFAPVAMDWFGFGPIETSAVVALIGMTTAKGVLNAVERVDFSGWLPGKKPAD